MKPKFEFEDYMLWVLPLAVGFSLVATSLQNLWEESKFFVHTQIIETQIESFSFRTPPPPSKSGTSESSHSLPSFKSIVNYQIIVDGQQFPGSTERVRSQNMAVGDKIKVEYVSDNPSINRPVERRHNKVEMAVQFVSGLLVIVYFFRKSLALHVCILLCLIDIVCIYFSGFSFWMLMVLMVPLIDLVGSYRKRKNVA